jgi:hypothetical protein
MISASVSGRVSRSGMPGGMVPCTWGDTIGLGVVTGTVPAGVELPCGAVVLLEHAEIRTAPSTDTVTAKILSNIALLTLLLPVLRHQVPRPSIEPVHSSDLPG